MSAHRRLVHVLPLLVVAVAVVRVVTADGSDDAPPASEAVMRSAYERVATNEAGMRLQALSSFRYDTWSQDDDFHNAELRLARSIAVSEGVRLGDILFAIDEGMREGWEAGDATPRPGVEPLRPRLSY